MNNVVLETEILYKITKGMYTGRTLCLKNCVITRHAGVNPENVTGNVTKNMIK